MRDHVLLWHSPPAPPQIESAAIFPRDEADAPGCENPYGSVHAVLRDLVEMQRVPAGAAGRLFSAHDRLLDFGDRKRAELCGSASVAVLKLQHALREGDLVKAAWQNDTLRRVLDVWQDIPLCEAGLFVPPDTQQCHA